MDDRPVDAVSFLGTGWGFPPRFSECGAAVDMAHGVDDIHQSLQILLSTQPGERLMQESFGCDTDSVLFEEFDQGLINALTGLVNDAILFHEPRIRLDRLDVIPSDTEHGLLNINIGYTIKSTNSRFNMVYPFHLTETAASADRIGA